MITVTHKRNTKGYSNEFYIGRPTYLGNPFVIGKHGDRAEVVKKYKAYILNEIFNYPEGNVAEAYNKLCAIAKKEKDLKLVCYCAPLACHGDVLKELIESSK